MSKRIHIAYATFAAVMAVCPAWAQDSIEARAAAQLARDTATAAKAVPAASSMSSNETLISKPAAARRPAGPPVEIATALELVSVKGFVGQLEAVIAVNGRRATVTPRSAQLPDGWMLTSLTADCAEVKKTTGKTETRSVCFVAPAQTSTAALAQFQRPPSPGMPLPAGAPIVPTPLPR